MIVDHPHPFSDDGDKKRRKARSWLEYWHESFKNQEHFDAFFHDVNVPKFNKKPNDPYTSPIAHLWDWKVNCGYGK